MLTIIESELSAPCPKITAFVCRTVVRAFDFKRAPAAIRVGDIVYRRTAKYPDSLCFLTQDKSARIIMEHPDGERLLREHEAAYWASTSAGSSASQRV